MRVDQRCPLVDRARWDVDDLEAQARVLVLVHPLERQRVLVADPAGRCRFAEPDRADKEHLAISGPCPGDPGDLSGQPGTDRVAEEAGQRERADR